MTNREVYEAVNEDKEMRALRKKWLVLVLAFAVCVGATLGANACTSVIIGKDASADGSVIVGHTDCCSESRVHVVPEQTHEKGSMAPIHWGMLDVRDDLRNYGEVIGEIPQVEKTHAYFHTGYPQMNEHQLAIGESTLAQKEELKAIYGYCKQIMTVEQAQALALQRCTKAKEAVLLIADLMETYGFLPSCADESESLLIADPEEGWILELFSVGNDWDPESGEPGVLWAAQRVPDDEITVIANWSIIKEIDLSKPDQFMASSNYQKVAIEHGWWDPDSGTPFIWQDVYAPATPWDCHVSRLWLFYRTFCPSLKDWSTNSRGGVQTDSYSPYITLRMPLSYFPFSAKPEKKVSVQDIMAFQRSVFEDTPHDMTNDRDWLVPDGLGGFVKSPLTTPLPTADWRELLDIDWHRVIPCGNYGMIAQLRSWLPDCVGGIYWLYIHNSYVAPYVPIYAGVKEISPLYSTYNPSKFEEDSARWVYGFVYNILFLKWQHAIKDLWAVRNPIEAGFFTDQPSVDAKAVELCASDPDSAKDFLTDLTRSRMEQLVDAYRNLRYDLITKYTYSR